MVARYYSLSRLLPILLLEILIVLVSPTKANAEIPLRGFGEIGYVSSTTNNNGTESNDNSFYNGALDIYIANSLSKKASFTAEIVFEAAETGSVGSDIERLTAQYHISPLLKIGAGRFHTALGYWNDNYHHGSWLHATITRPLIYHFEDEEGILPIHSEGIEVRGESDLGDGQIGYNFNFANGRGPRVDPPQTFSDKDKSKAISLLVYYAMPNLGNLRIGGLFYADTLPGCEQDPADATKCNSTTAATTARGKERIYGAHVVYTPGKLETFVEYFMLDHSYDTGEVSTRTLGGYAQVSYQFELWTPYYRFDSIQVFDSKTDAYTGLDGKTTGHTLGVRYDFDSTSALKLEYFRKELNHVSASRGTTASDSFKVNWSFTF